LEDPGKNKKEYLKKRIEELGKEKELKTIFEKAKKEIKTIVSKEDKMTKEKYWLV
jgi:hypothetical protein